MFERFTENARRAVFFARYEASGFDSPEIETHHLLLGVLREPADLLDPPLEADAIENIRKDLKQRFPPKQHVPTSADLPLSEECRRALAYAAEEAERLRHVYIDAGHLMLGLLREERSVAAAVLRKLGVELGALRSRLLSVQKTLSREDLYALVNQLPPERHAAAARILLALRRDFVKISVMVRDEDFEISFGSQGA